MRIYLSLRNAWYVKNLESVIQILLRRGHEVTLGLCEHYTEPIVALGAGAAGGGMTVTATPVRSDRWAQTVQQLRQVIDYLHFAGPAFKYIPYSRLRRRGEVPELAMRLIRRHQLRYGWRRRAAIWWLKQVAESLPPDAGILEHLKVHRPDVFVVCPLLGPEADQYEHVRAAKYLGIPTLYAVHSWDNLSSKGLVHMNPERIVVWNEIQRREAVGLHNQPEHRIATVGAYPFDYWFEGQPSTTRRDFLKRVGLPDGRPLILYLCSALYFAKSEPESDFVSDWLGRLRSCEDPKLSGSVVLIRPHPKRADEFANDDTGDPLTVVWPPRGEMPDDAERHAAFFDSLYHADAVVGLNTSAMIEAAIVGRQVHTILEPRYEISQMSTYHFKYLTNPKGGILRVATDWEMHFAQLRETLTNPESKLRTVEFIDWFVRPQGRHRRASDIVADEIEWTASRARLIGLAGVRLRPFTLPWLERMQSRVAVAEAEVARKPRQSLERWHERRQFLTSIERKWILNRTPVDRA